MLVAALLLAGCGDGSSDDSSGKAPATGDEVTRDEAHEMATQGVRGDPALSAGLPKDTFDALARTGCESLDAGGSFRELVDLALAQPTQSGVPMRRESAEAIFSAGVRGYCPQHSSQVP